MASDPRLYITVHNGMPEHPKVVALSDKAFRGLVELWCYCSRNLTDGKVPAAVVSRTFPPKTLRELLAAGLIREDGTSFEMHDYLEHQQSAQKVADLRERRREAGRKGGRARGEAQAKSKQVLEQNSSPVQPDTDPDTDTQKTSSSGRDASRPTRLPDSWTPTPEHEKRAAATNVELDREVVKFRAYCDDRGRTSQSWNSAFTQWLIKAAEFAARDNHRPRTSRPTTDDRVAEGMALTRRLAAEAAAGTQAHLPLIGATP